jgi:hypothetical protein
MLMHGAKEPLGVTSGLVLYLDAANARSYPKSGTTWFDRSGNGNNGTLVNGVGYNGSNYGSLSFDGVDDYVNVLSNINFSYGTGDYTLEIWFNSSISITSNKILLDQRNTTPLTGQPVIYISSLAKPIFYIEGSGNLIVGTTTITSNTWYHISVSKNSGVYTFYINAISEGTASNSVSVPTSGVRIGIDYIGSGGVNGRISAARIYKGKALSASEISQNFNAFKGRYGLT